MYFGLPVIPLIEGADVSEGSFDAKSGRMINSSTRSLTLMEWKSRMLSLQQSAILKKRVLEG